MIVVDIAANDGSNEDAWSEASEQISGEVNRREGRLRDERLIKEGKMVVGGFGDSTTRCGGPKTWAETDVITGTMDGQWISTAVHVVDGVVFGFGTLETKCGDPSWATAPKAHDDDATRKMRLRVAKAVRGRETATIVLETTEDRIKATVDGKVVFNSPR